MVVEDEKPHHRDELRMNSTGDERTYPCAPGILARSEPLQVSSSASAAMNTKCLQKTPMLASPPKGIGLWFIPEIVFSNIFRWKAQNVCGFIAISKTQSSYRSPCCSDDKQHQLSGTKSSIPVTHSCFTIPGLPIGAHVRHFWVLIE